MNKRAKSIGAFSFLMCLVVIAGMLIYYQYMNRQKAADSTKIPSTEVEKLIAKDMDQGYPETPKEVLDIYCRINQCLYKGATDENRASLIGQLRKMYTKELLSNNSLEQQTQQIIDEVAKFKSDKKVILSYTIDTSSVKYKTVKGKECAVINIAFFLRKSGDYMKSYEEFMLAKEEDKWKILGFQQMKSEVTTENQEGQK